MYCYRITNLINDKSYIGITGDIEKRWSDHKLGNGSILLYQAFKKYGVENFLFEIVFTGDENEVNDKEVELIADLHTLAPYGYNLTEGGGGMVGYKLSDETKKKMSASRTGEKHFMFGKKHSPETREKMSDKAKMRKHRKQLTGTKEKISETRKKLFKTGKLRAPKIIGANNPCSQPLEVDGTRYDCMRQAADATGIPVKRFRKCVWDFKRTGTWPRALRGFKIVLLQKKKES